MSTCSCEGRQNPRKLFQRQPLTARAGPTSQRQTSSSWRSTLSPCFGPFQPVEVRKSPDLWKSEEVSRLALGEDKSARQATDAGSTLPSPTKFFRGISRVRPPSLARPFRWGGRFGSVLILEKIRDVSFFFCWQKSTFSRVLLAVTKHCSGKLAKARSRNCACPFSAICPKASVIFSILVQDETYHDSNDVVFLHRS
jgi:hypothetical protein